MCGRDLEVLFQGLSVVKCQTSPAPLLRRRWWEARWALTRTTSAPARRWAFASHAWATRTAASTVGWTFHEALIGRAFPLARQLRKLSRDTVIKSAFRELRRDSRAAIALIQITTASDIFKVFGEGSIILSAWSVWTLTFTHLVAAAHGFQLALWVFRIAVSEGRINGKSIGGITDEQHLLTFVPAEFVANPRGDTVVMIGSRWLDMGIVLVEPEINFP